MVEETDAPAQVPVLRKRNKKPKNRRDPKRMRGGPDMAKKARISQKMKKLYQKRARDYNSDSDDDEGGEDEEGVPESMGGDEREFEREGEMGMEENEDGPAKGEGSDEEGDVEYGVLRFAEGLNSFRVAFNKIINTHVDDDVLGPVLSAHKKLVVAKLEEEDAGRKQKKEAKKEEHLVDEVGHVKPANFLDSHEKLLLGIATRGVVKFFNAVNKAQNAQKGLNPSRFKDAKVLTKRRKEAFMTELRKTSTQPAEATGKESTSTTGEDSSQPAWGALRDNFMLTNSKLKDWDKMADDTEMEM